MANKNNTNTNKNKTQEIKEKIEKKLGKYTKDEKYIRYVNAILTYGSLAVFIAFAIRPSISTAIRLDNNIEEFKIVDQQLTQKVESLGKAREFQFEYESEIALLDKAIPDKKRENEILSSVNFIAIDKDIDLQNIEFGYTHDATKKTNNILVVQELIGSYDNLLLYLEELKKMLRIVDVQIVLLERNEKDIEKYGEVLRVEVTAESYYLGEPTVVK